MNDKVPNLKVINDNCVRNTELLCVIFNRVHAIKEIIGGPVCSSGNAQQPAPDYPKSEVELSGYLGSLSEAYRGQFKLAEELSRKVNLLFFSFGIDIRDQKTYEILSEKTEFDYSVSGAIDAFSFIHSLLVVVKLDLEAICKNLIGPGALADCSESEPCPVSSLLALLAHFGHTVSCISDVCDDISWLLDQIENVCEVGVCEAVCEVVSESCAGSAKYVKPVCAKSVGEGTGCHDHTEMMRETVKPSNLMEYYKE